MLRTYIKIAFRNFRKDKFFSIINITGLSVGISVVLLITLYILQELSYDTFHTKYDRIHRIGMHLEVGGGTTDLNATFPPMADAMRTEIPEVEEVVRVYPSNGKIFKKDDIVFTEDKILYADSDFFKVFDFAVLAGNPVNALAKPYQVMLTPALALKYYSTDNWSQVIGNSILINQQVHEITGIVAEAPVNSHIHYTAIASMTSTQQGRDETWDNLNLSTYVLVKGQSTMNSVMEKLPVLFSKHFPNWDKLKEQGIVMEPISVSLIDIHLRSNVQGEFEPGGSVMNLFIFGSVACIVLLLACVNFINLLTARSANRAKEVGVRKVLGSSRSHLVRQFILECIILVSIATLLALGIVELIRTPFTLLAGKSLPFEVLLAPGNLALLLLFIIILGTLAGSYPAFFLSSFQPAQVLKGKIRSGFRSSKLRNILVMLQFVISIVLIACTLVLQNQLEFMRSKKLGFDKDNVLILDNANKLINQSAFVNAIESIGEVQLAGASTFRPVDDYDGMVVNIGKGKDNRKQVNFSRVDYDYLNVLKYEFSEGRNFSRAMASDSTAVIINERAAELLFDGEAIGKKLYHDYEYTVVGVVKDFNFESLKNEIHPLVFYLRPHERFLHIRISPGDHSATLAKIESAWKQQTSEIPFSYAFLDETYDNLFKEEVKLGALFSIFTGLGLFIACLGLMGLTAYMAEMRRKEISVRKVLGATMAQIIVLMSKDFARIVVIALVIAVPVAYYMMQQWLNEFVYKIEVSIGVLFLGGVIVIAVAFLAVSYQAIRSALINPVDSLKEE